MRRLPTCATGEEVTAVARPEMIQIAQGPGGGERPGIAWSGVVRQRFFRGSRHVYTVAAGAHSLNVDAPPDQPVAPEPRSRSK